MPERCPAAPYSVPYGPVAFRGTRKRLCRGCGRGTPNKIELMEGTMVPVCTRCQTGIADGQGEVLMAACLSNHGAWSAGEWTDVCYPEGAAAASDADTAATTVSDPGHYFSLELPRAPWLCCRGCGGAASSDAHVLGMENVPICSSCRALLDASGEYARTYLEADLAYVHIKWVAGGLPGC